MNTQDDYSALVTWEGVLDAGEIDALTAQLSTAMFIGQRAGDFSLGRSLQGGVAVWSSGRCFNDDVEIRWWQAETRGHRHVLVLNDFFESNDLPPGLTHRERQLVAPSRDVRFLCIGQYDADSPADSPLWWESRYGRAFAYLDTPPTKAGQQEGRVCLRAVVYEFEHGYTQHRLQGFEHA